MSTTAEARIVGLCIYYDENPEWLGQLLASLAPICRDFVFVDGAYGLFPGASDRPASSADSSRQLQEMAIACGRSLLHYRPSRPFYGNEVEKRNMTLDLARSLPEVAGDEDVWFLIADADSVAVKVSDAIPGALAETTLNVGEYAYEEAAIHLDNVVTGGRWDLVRRVELAKPQRLRCFYRNLPGLRYGPAHFNVSWSKPDGSRSWLWKDNLSRQETPVDLTTDLRFIHRQSERDPERQRNSLRYYEIRDAAGVERP